MRAGDVGRAARGDLQFRIPRKPVVRLGVRMRPEDDGWVLDGARKRQTLGGRFAREHLGNLLRACDGSRTIEEIGRETGIGSDGAFQAVSLLWTGGIVEEGDCEPVPGPEPAAELACLLSRLGESTGVNDSWTDAVRRLRAAQLTVAGDAELAAELVRALTPVLEARTGEGPQRGDTLVVLVETGASAHTTAAVGRRCRQAGTPLLRVRAEQEALTVGPYIDMSFSPCLECGTAGEPAPGPAPRPERRDLVVGLAARAIAALISRAATTHLPGDVRRTELEALTFSDRPVVTRPGCPVCSAVGEPGGSSGGPVADVAPVGARYEQSVAIPPAAFVDSKGHQQHYKPSNIQLQREFRDWPSCPRTVLPEADPQVLGGKWPHWEAGGGAPAPDALDRGPTLAELATVLALSVGLREPVGPQAPTGPAAPAPKTRRWTAAGGNIGSVVAYVLVADGGEDLAPGTYAYVERDHVLALVGPAPALPAGVGTRLVLTADVDKVSRKYFSFGLRLAIQDCGCAFEVIRLTAACLGLPVRARDRWDETEQAALLGTDPAREPVCAVIDMGGIRAL